MEKEILDPQTYITVEDPVCEISMINQRISDWTIEYPDVLSDKLKDWIVNDKANCGYYYLLYKAHKPEKNYPGRLITSACGSPTERLSSWIEYHLKPMMSSLSYRLEDSSHFLRNIETVNIKRRQDLNPPTITHCSWDIEAMYPNIENELGLIACKHLLDKRQDKFPPTVALVDAIKITLEENIAQFGDLVTKQKQGTAMGPHHACSYADAAADYAVDQKVMSEENQYLHNIAFWGRLRDDIYCAWVGTEDELMLFDSWLNNLNTRLNFTLEHSTNGTVFLDFFVSTGAQNCIKTQIYSKPCDSHAYLLPTSCHPTHICKNIPSGVMKRVCRNCTEKTDSLEAMEKFGHYLRDRQYSEETIQEAKTKALETPRDKLIGLTKSKSSKSSRKYPLIIKFNQRLPPMSKFIKQNLHILDLTNETKNIFNSDSIFVSYRMESNIKSLICKNKYTKKLSDDPIVASNSMDNDFGCFSCKDCNLCKNFLVEAKYFSSPKTNQKFAIKSHISCDSENVIYVIYDKICTGIFYVGYTCDNMRTRWANHKSHIKKSKLSCEISTHFAHHSTNLHKLDKSNFSNFTSSLSSQLNLIVIESVAPIQGKTMKEACQERENYWQGILKATKLFGGINKRRNKTSS